MDALDYQKALFSLLPTGDLWPTEPGNTPGWDELLRALSELPAALEVSARQLITESIPTEATAAGLLDEWAEFLGLPKDYDAEAWASYTEAQKQAAIAAHLLLAPQPSVTDLRTLFRTLTGEASATLHNRSEYLPFICNQSAAGYPVGDLSSGWWAFRYIPNTLDAPKDDFSDVDWDAGTVTVNTVNSPVTETLIADRLAGVAGTTYGATASYKAAACPVSGTANGDEVYCTVWLKSVSSDLHSAFLYMRERDGTTYTAATAFQLKGDLWQKCSIRRTVGSGGSDPLFVIVWLASGGDVYAAQAMAGVTQPLVEGYLRTLAPAHTGGVFMIQGEDL